jgi:hypothetical protein
MQCPNGCIESLEKIKEDKIFYRNDKPVVITDLVMYVCETCGQESMPLVSARMVENVLNGKVNSSGKFVAEKFETAEISY